MTSGLILLNKKPGITSFDALRDIKRMLRTGKVGHTGTLDKFAGGLLAVLVGKALRLSQWFSHCDKKYEGRICFGAETDTLDPEGSVIAEAAVPAREEVERVLDRFKGEIMQTPPVYSAIHVNGKRASELARSGEMPEMKKRWINIYKLEIKRWQPPFADIFVHCSSGTYIRSLARDIALAAGSRGYLSSLLRTQVAGFMLDMAVEHEGTEDWGPETGRSIIGSSDYCSKDQSGSNSQNFQTANHNPRSQVSNPGYQLPTPDSQFPFLKPVDKKIISALGMPWFDVTKHEAESILQGKSPDSIMNDKLVSSSASPRLCGSSSLNPASAVFYEETLVAVMEKIDGKWKYGCVLGAIFK